MENWSNFCLVIFAHGVLQVFGIPAAPFEAVWNIKTQGCTKKGVDIDLGQYGIRHNSNGADWKGDVITIFYNHGAFWPVIPHNGSADHADGKPGVDYSEWQSGGIPQEGNIEDFKEATRNYVIDRIPQADFDGLGCLDFEEWRPWWDINFDPGEMAPYREASINKITREHPDITDEAEIERMAKEEFDAAAREFFEAHIDIAREERPNALWGYYHFAHCFYGKRGDDYCAQISYEANEELDWLAKKSDVLFPTIYFMPKMADEDKRGWAFGNCYSTEHWRNVSGAPYMPIYPYTKLQIETKKIEEVDSFYTEADLVNSIGLVADQGLEGIVFWGNAYLQADSEICGKLKTYIDGKVGPYIRKVLDFTQRCSEDLCNGQGRCRKNDISLVNSEVPQTIAESHNYDETTVRAEYSCRCYEGFSGEDCSN